MLLRKGRTPNRSWLKGLQLNHNPQIATSREFRTIFAALQIWCGKCFFGFDECGSGIPLGAIYEGLTSLAA